jgi:signal recognition particle GTPase
MRNDYKQRPRPGFKKGGKAFPDLTGDGKVTFKDILKGRKAIKHGGKVKEAMHKMPSGKKMKNSDMKKNKK